MPIVIVSTGGTIASTDRSSGDAVPELSAENLVSAVPELGALADIRTRDFSNVPSTQFTVEQLAELSALLGRLDDDPTVDGIVITQGTDILEESAFFVDLCYDGETPLVFTGAMRNPSLPSPDGPINLLSSVRTAQSSQAEDAGVLVCFNERVHAAATVTKADSMNVDTFRSPTFGPLATVDEDRVTWRQTAVRETQPFDPDPEQLTADVHALTVTAAMPAIQVRAAADAAGLCLAATGAGHVPPSIIPALEDLREKDVPIIATTRCYEGRLARSTYGFRGSEATLQELGCYYSRHNLQKTRIKAIVALAGGGLDRAFDRPMSE